jgi:superfamily II DNA/RNA helicase
MFSATFPKSARRLAKEYMDEDCVRISRVSTFLNFMYSLLTSHRGR